jgi:sugar phosphate isomerase/epimerase
MTGSLSIAVSTGSLYHLPTLESIKHLRRLGIRDVELTLQPDEFSLTFERKLSMPILEDLSAMVQSGELCVRSVHAPAIHAERSGYNLQARLQLLVHAIEVCHLLGGQIVVVHPFHLFPVHEDVLNYLSGHITRLQSALLPGIDHAMEVARTANIRLALENIQDWQDEIFLNAPANMSKFLRDVGDPAFGCTLDLMHAQYPNTLDEFLDSLSADILNIHASDLLPPVQRVAIGKGVIDWNRIAPKIRKLPNLYQITVELSNPQDEDLTGSVKLISSFLS